MAKSIIFDLDDTLYLERDYVYSGFLELDNFLKAKFKLDGFFETSKQIFDNGEANKVFDKALSQLNFSYDLEFIKDLIHIYRNHKPKIFLEEDSLWALKYYKNYNLGLITDGYIDSQKRKISALNLKKFINKIICTDELGGKKYWKPHPKSFVSMQNFFQNEFNDFIYIGDNPKKDFISPKKLGWKTIQIVRDYSIYKRNNKFIIQDADFLIKSLYELKDII